MKYVREVSVTLNVETKEEIHVLEDCFGHRHLVQIPILFEGDHDAALQQEMADMEERTRKFIEVATQRGHDVQKLRTWGEDDAPEKAGCKECP
jgi:hypothetical protein